MLLILSDFRKRTSGRTQAGTGRVLGDYFLVSKTTLKVTLLPLKTTRSFIQSADPAVRTTINVFRQGVAETRAHSPRIRGRRKWMHLSAHSRRPRQNLPWPGRDSLMVSAMKVATGKILLERRSALEDAVKCNLGDRRSAGNFQRFGERKGREARKEARKEHDEQEGTERRLRGLTEGRGKHGASLAWQYTKKES